MIYKIIFLACVLLSIACSGFAQSSSNDIVIKFQEERDDHSFGLLKDFRTPVPDSLRFKFRIES